jgi:hypothetical protein
MYLKVQMVLYKTFEIMEHECTSLHRTFMMQEESFPIENMQNGVTSKYVHLIGTHSQQILLYST